MQQPGHPNYITQNTQMGVYVFKSLTRPLSAPRGYSELYSVTIDYFHNHFVYKMSKTVKHSKFLEPKLASSVEATVQVSFLETGCLKGINVVRVCLSGNVWLSARTMCVLICQNHVNNSQCSC